MHRGISLLQCLYHTSTHSNDKTVLARAPGSSNSPKTVLIFWSSIPCVFCLYMAKSSSKVIYDLSVLSMSVMGFQIKFGWGGVGVGGVSSIQVFLDFRNLFNFAKPHN